MARTDIQVTRNGYGIHAGLNRHPGGTIADLTEEEAGELATKLLQALGCSFEIKWPVEKDIDEVLAERRGARQRLREEASHYVSANAPRWFTPDDREVLAEAYKAGYMAAPKPVTAVLR